MIETIYALGMVITFVIGLIIAGYKIEVGIDDFIDIGYKLWLALVVACLWPVVVPVMVGYT